eukprot:1586061-Amphidinium_carterae.1
MLILSSQKAVNQLLKWPSVSGRHQQKLARARHGSHDQSANAPSREPARSRKGLGMLVPAVVAAITTDRSWK